MPSSSLTEGSCPVARHNQRCWDREARESGRWSTPVAPSEIEKARQGNPRIFLSPDTPVPEEWLGNLREKQVLCLASGGGQQAPLLAAAGAQVTSFDLSQVQLDLDLEVAKREGLSLSTMQGDMRDLSAFEDSSFDLIVHVISNVFCPEIQSVWTECFRVLRPGGDLLSGMLNPVWYLFDHDSIDEGRPPVAVFPLPYSDETRLSPERFQQLIRDEEQLEFSHSLDDQIGGQLKAGFLLKGFFEDSWDEAEPLNSLFPPAFNTWAHKSA